MVVPTIVTDRLVLRAHRAADFHACAALWADPRTVRYIGGVPQSPAQTWSRMLRYAGLWSLLGYGYWAIEERATAEFVGELGFADFKREIEPALDGMPELGWVIAADRHRRGYATEAVAAALEWSDRRLGGTAICCLINPANIASLRVASTAGFAAFAQTTLNSEPLTIFRRTG